jgi:hypothetical protein
VFKRVGAAVVAAGLVLVSGGCGGGADGKADASGKASADATPTRPPSKKLVEWVGDMCESTAELKAVRKESAAQLKEIRNPDEHGPGAEVLAVGYVSHTPTVVEDVERDMGEFGSSDVPKADRLLEEWRKKLKRVVSELDDVSPGDAFDDAEGSAEDVDEHVQSLTSPKPGLPALMKKDPQLKAAHKRAKQCAPGWKPEPEEDAPAPASTGPLPKAADGKKTSACTDGACEILVTSTENVTAKGVNVHISVSEESVTFSSGGTIMQLGGVGGVASFGDEVAVTVLAHNKDGAVLKFAAP